MSSSEHWHDVSLTLLLVSAVCCPTAPTSPSDFSKKKGPPSSAKELKHFYIYNFVHTCAGQRWCVVMFRQDDGGSEERIKVGLFGNLTDGFDILCTTLHQQRLLTPRTPSNPTTTPGSMCYYTNCHDPATPARQASCLHPWQKTYPEAVEWPSRQQGVRVKSRQVKHTQTTSQSSVSLDLPSFTHPLILSSSTRSSLHHIQ